MDSETSSIRNSDTTTLMNYGFNNYKTVTLYKKGEVISTHTFNDAKEKNTQIVAKEEVKYVIKKNEEPSSINVTLDISSQSAPISKETSIGKILITNQSNGWQTFYNIYVKDDVEKLKFKELLLIYWKALIN